MNDRLVAIGIVGTIFTTVCCFTPLLPVIFAAIGFGGVAVWLDHFLIPALLFFICLTAISMWRHSHGK